MIKVEYRVKGSGQSTTPVTKEFATRAEAQDWIWENAESISVLSIEIESTGAAALSRIFG